ncbi:MAG: topoisomerase [Gammaproteobacteria bacterium]|nr:topoisomerase [Gammaproteobacteria bacterium]
MKKVISGYTESTLNKHSVNKMAKNLIIVESPAKAKTIGKYLGKDFEVLASYGHVRDLIPKEGAVDPQNNFAMKYDLIQKNAKYVDAIAKALKGAEALYLATDPDREGEAISWHLLEIIRSKRGLSKLPARRVVFHEITKSAVTHAIEHPRELAMDLVNAQQARRALDYLVGFTLSPLLWRKVRPGLSAGRVQSPSLRMIVEREEEIEKFQIQEYWTIEAEASFADIPFPAKLVEYENKKLEQFSIVDESTAEETKKALLKAGKKGLPVTKVEKKQRKRHPSPPFITSTLQQEAARKLGFTTDRTMRIAQQLYEGISLGKEGSVGLITYMRTDSVHLAQEAVQAIRDFIETRYGKENLPDTPRFFKTKSKNAQEAHEAIRPTTFTYPPESIKHALNEEQLKLYTLIWKRAIACQMIHATINTMSVDMSCGEGNRFRATGSVIAIPGFISVYQEGIDDAKKVDGEDQQLPDIKEGDIANLIDIAAIQHFTEPPPRYTEASLVKALEEHGIGRPSTYSSIIYTLKHREYVTIDQKRFKPTDVGRIVSHFLTKYFTQYVDYDFTANLEDQLDAISRGEEAWIPMLEHFWTPFKNKVAEIKETVQRSDVTQEALDEACPKCGKPLSIRLGKRGRFIGCTAYPECDYTRSMDGEVESTDEPEIVEGRTCPECSGQLLFKRGRYGKFIGCANYPKCKHIEPLEKPADTGITCPECKSGHMLQRKSRYGKIFYSCENYPKCKYAIWNEPIAETCPTCQWPILSIRITKRWGTEKVCPQKECDFKETLIEPEKTEKAEKPKSTRKKV